MSVIGPILGSTANRYLKSLVCLKDHVMSTGISCAPPSLKWHALYHAALFENDRNKLPERIGFATPADHIEEDVVLDDALYALQALRSCAHSPAAAA